MSTLQPVSVTRLYLVIANQIKDKIREGIYQHGERLPAERELAEMLKVSRPSVREALIALELEGWVDVRVGTGIFVTGSKSGLNSKGSKSLDSSHLQDAGAADLLNARLLLEPHIAELAARNATDAQIKAMEETTLSLPNADKPFKHNDRLHLLIAEACGNVALLSTLQHLWTLSEQSAIFNKLNQHFVYGEVWEIAHKEHLHLLRALKKRQPEAARRAMRKHLLGICSRLGLDANNDKDV